MGKNNRQGKPSGKSRPPAARQPKFARGITMLVTGGVIMAAAFFLLHGNQTGAQLPSPPVNQESVAAPGVKAGFDRLKGRWMRPDGGYVIEIKAIDAHGKMVAAYFNPRPINVSRAEASQEGATTRVFIELRDVNYPGATYTLTYDPESDQLKGVYFQPAFSRALTWSLSGSSERRLQ